MGCCAIRNVTDMKKKRHSTQLPMSIENAHKSLQDEALEMNIRSIKEVDPKLMEILSYIIELNRENKWVTAKESPSIGIYSREGSKYDPKIPIAKIRFSFNAFLSLRSILDYLQMEEKRKSWDSNIKKIEVIEGERYRDFISYTYVSIMGMFKGDLLERKVLVTYNNFVVLISFSVEHPDRPILDDCNRSTNHFGVYVFHENEKGLGVTYYTHTDPNNKLVGLFKSKAPLLYSQWFNNLKKVVIGKANVD